MPSRTADPRAASRPERLDFGRLVPFWTMLALALVFGGASRASSLSQPVVRTGSVLVIAWCVLSGSGRGWRDWPLPFRLLALLGAWMALQLVPVPPFLWQLQAGAVPYAAALGELGLAGDWRSLSLSPDLTLNSLFALLPLVALAVAGSGLRLRELETGLLVVLAVVALNVLAEVGQLAGALPSFHRVSNPGSEAGLFANRNHHAALLCCALPLLGAWARNAPRGSPRPWIALGSGLLVLALVLAVGSRAGLVIAPVAALLGGAAALAGRRRGPLGRGFWLGTVAVIVAAVALAATVLLAGRDRALGRLIASDQGEELRFRVLGTLGRIAYDFRWFGAGFGTFDPVFRGYEPRWALKPTFLNHAHNDLVEIAIEGGLPALALLAAFLFWAARRSAASWRGRDPVPRAASVVLAILVAWSLLDYPLRTPALAVLAGWCALLLARTGEVGADRAGSARLAS